MSASGGTRSGLAQLDALVITKSLAQAVEMHQGSWGKSAGTGPWSATAWMAAEIKSRTMSNSSSIGTYTSGTRSFERGNRTSFADLTDAQPEPVSETLGDPPTSAVLTKEHGASHFGDEVPIGDELPEGFDGHPMIVVEAGPSEVQREERCQVRIHDTVIPACALVDHPSRP